MKQGGWKLVVAIVLLHVVLYTIFMREEWIHGAIASERDSAHAVFGEDLAVDAHNRGVAWYTTLMVDSGVVYNTFAAYTVPKEQRNAAEPTDNMWPAFFDWWEGRLRLFFTVFYQACLRASAAVVWLPYTLLLLIPFVVDGLVQRQIKKTNFDYVSPILHRYSLHLIEILAVAIFMLFFAPWAMPVWLVPTVLVVCSASAGLILSNTQKRA